MTQHQTSWADYGEAEFDRRLMPKGHKQAAPDQASLFLMAVEPVRKASPAAEQLPGQASLFGGDGE
jgi:hypothetical protein